MAAAIQSPKNGAEEKSHKHSPAPSASSSQELVYLSQNRSENREPDGLGGGQLCDFPSIVHNLAIICTEVTLYSIV